MPDQAQTTKHRGIGRPVGSTKEATLARILPAARELFANQGYSKTTFKDVGNAVGMTHAALYGYFPSKAALFAATCEHAQELILVEYAIALAEEKTLSAVDTASFRAENARPASRRGTQAVNGGRL